MFHAKNNSFINGSLYGRKEGVNPELREPRSGLATLSVKFFFIVVIWIVF